MYYTFSIRTYVRLQYYFYLDARTFPLYYSVKSYFRLIDISISIDFFIHNIIY